MKQTNDIEKQNLSIELNFLLNISYFNSTDIKIKKTYVDLDMTCDIKFDSNWNLNYNYRSFASRILFNFFFKIFMSSQLLDTKIEEYKL